MPRYSRLVCIMTAIMFLVAACGAPESATSSSAPMPTDTPVRATQTPVPATSTPAPTDTPVPPTHTLPAATDTPKATSTPAAEPSLTPVPTVTSTPLPPLDGSGGGVLAFASDLDGDDEIYAMNLDGSGLRQLTENHVHDSMPSWSPDGARIAFDSKRDGDMEVYVMDADGNNQTRLTESRGQDGWIGWSPYGTHIVFYSLRNDNGEVYLMEADGSNPIRLTQNTDGDFEPSWSPDGTRIAFMSERDGDPEVYVLTVGAPTDTDGGNPQRLTDQPGDDWDPDWSPDGARIAFCSQRDGNWEIYVMNADGREQTRLTDYEGDDSSPAWSPDGSQIAFVSDRDGHNEVYVMSADGGDLLQITHHGADARGVDWRPDPTSVPEEVGQLQMTIVYDNTAYDSRLGADWGFSAWLEYDGHTILFDTGTDGSLLLGNMETLGLDPLRVEIVVLSHIHGDHTGGLQTLLDTGVQPTVYVPSTFPHSYVDEIRAQTTVVEVIAPSEIAPGLHTTGELLERVPEQGLVVETSEGSVVITGCAHPGILNMVDRAHVIVAGDIALVVGGFHLGEATRQQIQEIISGFRDHGVRQVSPTHCSGSGAKYMFRTEYGDDYITGGAGQVFVVGSIP